MTILMSRPGTSWRYSNYGFGLLGHALERATGRPYEALLQEKLLTPLEMFDAKISLTAGDLEGSLRTTGPMTRGWSASAGSSARSAPLLAWPRPCQIWHASCRCTWVQRRGR